jgi:tellurite resistance protein
LHITWFELPKVLSGRELPKVSPARLRSALRGALALESPRLVSGAAQTRKDEPEDADSARHFQALLEAGYLVASADGLEDEERHALAELLEEGTGAAFDRATFELHFRDLDASVAMLGRHERLRRTAEEFNETAAREEALGFALLVAIGDGKLAAQELAMLFELGVALGFSKEALEQRFEQTIGRLERELRSAE